MCRLHMAKYIMFHSLGREGGHIFLPVDQEGRKEMPFRKEKKDFKQACADFTIFLSG